MANHRLVYLDSQATTKLEPRVLEAMMPFLTEDFGNAASRSHDFGWAAEKAVDHAREILAASLGGKSREIVFTSGATESNNLAILGAARMYQGKGKHVISAATEHKAVIDPLKRLESDGWEVTWLDVDDKGRIDIDQLRASIRPDTTLVTLMHGNNEIGTIHPIAKIGAICHEAGVLFHTDATQTFGKETLDVGAMHIDLLSASAHKMYGPKGVGLLYVRRRNPRVRLEPIQFGGGHERGMRSGTLNVPGIVGFGKATELCLENREAEQARMAALRDRLQQRLESELDFVRVNGDQENRLAANLNISFAYIEGESLIMGIPGIAVSSGSACTSASLEPSYVLRAMGVGDDMAHSSIRFGVSRFSTEDEVDYAADCLIAAVRRLREMSPLYEMALEGIDINSVQWQGH
ncbi:MAG: IscS subfamily cysteine desulfurase [Planctomycetes bacterium]|nr:IscS subfamily cysteine desulfurase [Planctomycetota bacterium]